MADKLVIDIDVSKAKQAIDALKADITSLSTTIDNLGKGGGDTSKFAGLQGLKAVDGTVIQSFRDLAKAASELSNVPNFSKVFSQASQLASLRPVSNEVITSMRNLKDGIEGLARTSNLTPLMNQLRMLSELRLSGFGPATVQALKDMATALNGFSNVPNFGTLVRNLEKLGTLNLKPIDPAVLQNLNALGAAVSRLAGAGTFGTLINNLNKLGSIQIRPIDPATIQSLNMLGQALRNLQNVPSLTKVANDLMKFSNINLSGLTQNMQAFSNALRNLHVPANFGTMATQLAILGQGLNQATHGLNAFANAQRASQGVSASWSQSFYTMQGVLAAFGVQLGAVGFANFISGAYEVVKSLDAFKNAITGTMGTVTTSGRELEFIRNLSESTATSVLALASSYAKFAASASIAGVSIDQVRSTFENFTVAARVMNLSGEQTKLMFRALEQMFSKGKVTAEELRQQLGEQLPGAMNLMAKAMGISTAELNKMMEAGKVGSENILKLGEMVKQTWGAQLPEALKQVGAQLALLENRWTTIKEGFGKGFFDGILKGLTDLQQKLKDPSVEQFAQKLGAAVAGGVNEAIAAIDRLKTVLGFLGEAFSGVGSKIGSFVSSVVDMIPALRNAVTETDRVRTAAELLAKQLGANSLHQWTIGILAQGKAMGEMATKALGLEDVLKKLDSAVKNNNFGGYLEELRKAHPLVGVLSQGADKAKESLNNMATAAKNAGTAVNQASNSGGSSPFENVKKGAENASSAIGKLGTNLFELSKTGYNNTKKFYDAWDKFFEKLGNFNYTSLSDLEEAFKRIGESAGEAGKGAKDFAEEMVKSANGGFLFGRILDNEIKNFNKYGKMAQDAINWRRKMIEAAKAQAAAENDYSEETRKKIRAMEDEVNKQQAVIDAARNNLQMQENLKNGIINYQNVVKGAAEWEARWIQKQNDLKTSMGELEGKIQGAFGKLKSEIQEAERLKTPLEGLAGAASGAAAALLEAGGAAETGSSKLPAATDRVNGLAQAYNDLSRYANMAKGAMQGGLQLPDGPGKYMYNMPPPPPPGNNIPSNTFKPIIKGGGIGGPGSTGTGGGVPDGYTTVNVNGVPHVVPTNAGGISPYINGLPGHKTVTMPAPTYDGGKVLNPLPANPTGKQISDYLKNGMGDTPTTTYPPGTPDPGDWLLPKVPVYEKGKEPIGHPEYRWGPKTPFQQRDWFRDGENVKPGPWVPYQEYNPQMFLDFAQPPPGGEWTTPSRPGEPRLWEPEQMEQLNQELQRNQDFIDNINKGVDDATKQYDEFGTQGGETSDLLNEFNPQLDQTGQGFNDLGQSTGDTSQNLQDAGTNALGFGDAMAGLGDHAEEVVDLAPGFDQLGQETGTLGDEAKQTAPAVNKLGNEADGLANAADRMAKSMPTAAEQAHSLADGTKQVDTAADNAATSMSHAAVSADNLANSYNNAAAAARDLAAAQSALGGGGGGEAVSAREGGMPGNFVERASVNMGMFANAPSFAGGTTNTSRYVSSMAGGGFPAVLHGGEAVVPLSHGRSIPVEFSNTGLNKAQEQIALHVDVNPEKLGAVLERLDALTRSMNAETGSHTVDPPRHHMADSDNGNDPSRRSRNNKGNTHADNATYNININVKAIDVDSFRKTGDQLTRELTQKIRRVQRQLG